MNRSLHGSAPDSAAVADPRLEFQFGDMTVGRFREPTFPAAAGRYRYEPYRGPGHHALGLRLQETGEAQCHYEAGSGRVFFTVCGIPGYGVLEVGGPGRNPGTTP